jgi:hypothetical protein
MYGESGYAGHSADTATTYGAGGYPGGASYGGHAADTSTASSTTSGYPGSPSYGAPSYSSTTDTSASMYPTGADAMHGPEVAYNPTPTMDTSFSQPALEYYCSSCGQSVPEHINDRCPHCGIAFAYVEQPDGSRKYNGVGIVGGGFGLLVAIIGVIIRVILLSRRN